MGSLLNLWYRICLWSPLWFGRFYKSGFLYLGDGGSRFSTSAIDRLQWIGLIYTTRYRQMANHHRLPRTWLSAHRLNRCFQPGLVRSYADVQRAITSASQFMQ